MLSCPPSPMRHDMYRCWYYRDSRFNNGVLNSCLMTVTHRRSFYVNQPAPDIRQFPDLQLAKQRRMITNRLVFRRLTSWIAAAG